MEPTPDYGFKATQIVDTALANLGPQLFVVAGGAITVGVGLLALNKGWGLVRKFI